MSSERQQPALGEPVIRVDGVGKTYRMYEKPSQRLWQALTGRDGKHREFHALRDVSFQVRRGETVGIIGRNGSGKSTLLQIIAGTLRPTTGTCEVHGRVAALLELGSGFNPDFTGRENVYLNGTILGLTRAQIDERMQQILDFADIGEFIDQPVRSYRRWKAGDIGRIDRDAKARLSNLMGIHKALRLIFREPQRGYAWVKAGNEAFGGKSALEVMLGGELTDLMRVRRYLDAERGLW